MRIFHGRGRIGNPAGRRISRYPGWVKAMAVVLILAFCGLTLVPAGWAESAGQASREERSRISASETGLEVASLILTVVPYGPFKLVFAIVGGVIGGMTFVFSAGNTEAAKSVWYTTVYGTYVLTPDHLRGDKPVRFLGVPPDTKGGE